MNHFRLLKTRLTLLVVDESGMSTVEYAIGTIAAAAFGAILYTVVTGDSIVSEYAIHCDGAFECRNLKQLERFVEHLA